nr:Exopolysaccharide biosynthesis protein YbjH [Candidatus Pantoea persica]
MLEPTVVASQLTDLKYNAGLSGPRIQTKGSTLYVSGEQTKYRDTREGVDRANRIITNNLPASIEAIEITESRFNMPQVTTRTDVDSLRH